MRTTSCLGWRLINGDLNASKCVVFKVLFENGGGKQGGSSGQQMEEQKGYRN